MIQLFAYESGTKYELDLYPEEPIKINVSAENITTVGSTDSLFSRSFRLPATNRNSRFFKYWFTAGIADFDITSKVSAEIHVDGIVYRTGQLRLSGTYDNNLEDVVDFEVHFLGETKDFATQVGDITMNQLPMGQWNFEWNTIDDLRDSWRAFNDAQVLAEGVVRWGVAQRGNTYDSDGLVDQNWEIALDESGTPHTKSFGKNAHPLDIDGFTPFVQVKAIIQAIFDRTNYSFSANSVFNEQWFQYLYTDGLNEAQPTTNTIDTGFVAQTISYDIDPSLEEKVEYSQELYDGSNAYDPSTYIYTVPQNGTYQFDGSLLGTFSQEPGSPTATLTLRMYVNGVEVASDVASNNTQSQQAFNLFVSTPLQAFVAGDEIYLTIESGGGYDRGIVQTGSFGTATAPQLISPSQSLLKSDVKAIDFFKGILNKFRLVMVPSKEDPLKFIVKPWADYIGTGDAFDWSEKLDLSKDMNLRPIFYSQTQDILFTDIEDSDRQNQTWQDSEGVVYGRKLFKSENELLEDTKIIDSVFAPTPVNLIQGHTIGTVPSPVQSNFYIPYFTTMLEEVADHGNPQHIPMMPKCRLLFWNGLADIDPTENWHYTDGITTYDETQTYPRFSPTQNIITTPSTRNLNWQTEEQYLLNDNSTGLFEYYWSDYIDSIYSNSARLLTAYFVLDSEDLRNLTFDDTIFVRDSWWRLNRIIDAPLGEVESVKVELIKVDKQLIPPGIPNEDSVVQSWPIIP